MNRKTLAAWLVGMLCVLPPFSAHAYEPENTFVASAGSMPLILTVPHDGGDSIGWVGVRTQGTNVRDVDTRDLAEEVAEVIQKKTGKRPYLVIAKISRKYIDVNRPEEDAIESPDAAPAYRAYHAKVAAYVAEVSAKYPKGALLIDVHGQSEEADTIFRGTGSGKTVKALLKKYGNSAIQGEGSIVALLQEKGYRVFPSVQDSSLKEHPHLNGGYTVSKYGSNTATGIDAIQLEFGKNTRNNSRLPEDVSNALLAFMNKYVPE
jgi:N-formylglutamate amidohydrolase